MKLMLPLSVNNQNLESSSLLRTLVPSISYLPSAPWPDGDSGRLGDGGRQAIPPERQPLFVTVSHKAVSLAVNLSL